jgi:Winged helix DNA-binding domain
MSAGELQLAARIDGLRPDDVRDALWRHRTLVKTWAYRQTLHLLTPDDYAGFVAAAASLERWHTPVWLRYFNQTEAQVGAMIETVGDVLSDRPMTRSDLVAAVTDRLGTPELAKEMLTGWGTFLAPAAQRGRLIFGPSDGRNVAFVDPGEWLGRDVSRSDVEPAVADAALGRLILRYLRAFPGATKEMIGRWWGGGRMAAVNRALRTIAGELDEVDVEGARGLVLRADVAAVTAQPEPAVRLLPGFDPWINEVPRRVDSVLAADRHDLVHRTAGWVTPVVVVDGRVAGTWEITGNGARGAVEVAAWDRWRPGARKELKREVDRLAAFLDRPLRLVV